MKPLRLRWRLGFWSDLLAASGIDKLSDFIFGLALEHACKQQRDNQFMLQVQIILITSHVRPV